MGISRKLAAIMFTDMVGYTLLMQTDEKKAKVLRDRHRSVQNNLISKHGGDIIQYYGDGTLCIFTSSISAVQCGMELQKEFAKEPKVPLRIGIHTGDIVHDDEGIYGDGVNIASRVESMAISGSVLFTDKVMDDLKNQKDFQIRSMGTFKLKNVTYPVEILALSNEGITTPSPGQMQGKGEKQRKSLAVLPFVNMSNDPENEYFSDGITEEILNVIARIDEIRVTARTSSFSFKGKNIDIREVARELNVDYVLEGSVRRAGNRVRIVAQLIAAKDGFHIWSENFDRELEDIFALQDEIAQNISSRLAEKLIVKAEKKPKTKITNTEAYKLYLKGNHHWKRWTPESVLKAIDYYHQAIDLDPELSLAYTGLAGAYIFMGISGQLSGDVYNKAINAGYKAIQLDDEQDAAHMAMGMIKFLYERKDEEAEIHFKRALEINPDNSEAHQYYSMYLSNSGDVDAALREMEIAYELDPLSLKIIGGLADVTFYSGRDELALERYKNALELDSNFRQAWEGIGWVYCHLEDYPKALKSFSRYQSMTGSKYKGLSGLGYTLAKLGRRREAMQMIVMLEERQKMEPEKILNMDFAIIYEGLGVYEKVAEHLENGLDKKMGGLFMNVHPVWEETRKRPEIKELLIKHGFIEP